jgi:hypothetical protein
MYEIFNPEIPGLEPLNPGISGLRKTLGIRDPGIGIPICRILASRGVHTASEANNVYFSWTRPSVVLTGVSDEAANSYGWNRHRKLKV